MSPSDEVEPVDQAFQEFMALHRDQTHQVDNSRKLNQSVIDEKNKKLIPFRRLLKRMEDMGVQVRNTESYQPGKPAGKSVPLAIYENTSSPSWRPGQSLYMDDPGIIEIAVPNGQQEGAVVIRCNSEHPKSELLHQRFETIKEACIALAKFLAYSTVRIEREPPK